MHQHLSLIDRYSIMSPDNTATLQATAQLQEYRAELRRQEAQVDVKVHQTKHDFVRSPPIIAAWLMTGPLAIIIFV